MPQSRTQAGWTKSTRSSGVSDNCIEVRIWGRWIGVRDSKERSGAVFTFAPPAWDAFLADVKAGRFDR
ncbi:DUF397 domain-containing protein [Saccharopolyspora gloriosae]|uniref:DUF397 domain-containing protein n=1 Tax=Saccharopolyspora gloriosae TaxID=455344 RepID=UPI001FB6F0C3|nr:DUF397 domain-containing protein [Saccharopolyspora gloriosae]